MSHFEIRGAISYPFLYKDWIYNIKIVIDLKHNVKHRYFIQYSFLFLKFFIYKYKNDLVFNHVYNLFMVSF